MRDFIKNHIVAYNDLLLTIGSDEIIKRLQRWLNNPQCGHKEGQKFPFFGWDKHQGKSSHVYNLWYSMGNSQYSISCIIKAKSTASQRNEQLFELAFPYIKHFGLF